MIKIQSISKSFGERLVLNDISGVFEKGKPNLIIGASGTGKSVLLKCIVGLIHPDEGSVFYDGRDFYGSDRNSQIEVRREMGMLFQGGALFDSKNVEDNVMFPLNVLTKMALPEKKDRVNFCLKRVGLENVNGKMPSEISGGMKKRVGIARAIVLNPKYLFCDEPNSGLDPQTSMVIDRLIKDITLEYNITTVVNTHDMNSVMENGDNIIYMYDGQKEWEGNKNEIIFSKNQRLNDFIFASEFLKDAKDMRMLEETGKIPNDRDMEEIVDKDAPPLIPPDEKK